MKTIQCGCLMKRSIAIFLMVSMLLAMTLAADAQAPTQTGNRIQLMMYQLEDMTEQDIESSLLLFSDMQSHWSRRQVGKLATLGVLSGYPDGRFAPNDTLNVDQFIKLIVKAIGFNPDNGKNYWAQPYIDVALEQKLINVGEYKTYNQPIKREQAARLVNRAMLLKDYQPHSNMMIYIRNSIKDYHSIGNEYKQDVLNCYGMGLINGSGGYFNPKKTLTRAEGSVLIMRNLDRSERVSFAHPEGVKILWMADRFEKDYLYPIYPPSSNSEIFESVEVLQECEGLTKGYDTGVYYSPFSQLVSIISFESKEAFQNEITFGMDMSIDIETIDAKSFMTVPYEIAIFDVDNVVQLHRDVLVKFFQHLFGKDAKKVIDLLDEHFKKSKIDDLSYHVSYIFNNREISFSKFLNKEVLSIYISSKQ